APDTSKLPSEAKADEVFPATFDLVALQSPVKSQGSRGVCSIFSTTALMEHLYIKEGTLANPDFSEQFLQWSAKFEVRQFTQTSGSNAHANLRAISRYGVVDEIAWPYQSSPWGSSDLEDCGKEESERPTECFTNGSPPESAMSSKRWFLPRGRYVSSRTRSIKAVMRNNQTAVVSGMTFFYQSWNHRRSALPTSRAYWAEGYVLPPNDEDRKLSLEKRAGHSILLVGWNDDLEVPLVDEKGEPVTDDEGNPVVEKGFFLFKNSWGTGGFGLNNPFGAGYGWIAYSYVEEFANSMTANIPDLDLEPEVCDDNQDNNLDRQVDCDDPQCATFPACQPEPTAGELSNLNPVDIPDNAPAGASSTIEVEAEGFATALTVTVEIEHTFIGDLIVTLTSPDGRTSILHDRTGRSDDNIKANFEPADMLGANLKGTWTLSVSDHARIDTGAIKGWSMTFETSATPEVCDDNQDNTGDGLIDCDDPACAEVCMGAGSLSGSRTPEIAIPDDNSEGIRDTITLTQEGQAGDIRVEVEIEHTFIGDLTVTLTSPAGTTIVLHDQEGNSTDDLKRSFTLDDFSGEATQGDWTLAVSDNAAEDTGILKAWSLTADLK
ncbi:MAG: proprotein convertase P-domain-containing protein, partial [Myxococcota bacterium]